MMKTFWQTQFGNFRSLWLAALVILIPLLAFLTYVIWQQNAPVYEYLDDPVGYIGKMYYGIGSNVGMLFWCSAAAICLFSGALLKRAGAYRIEFARFLWFSGVVTAILLLDDLFLLHDRVIPIYTRVDQEALYIGYVAMLGLYLFEFRNTLLKTELLPLVLAFVLMATSVFVDEAVENGWLSISYSPLSYLVEDGSKLLGISMWFLYFARVCWLQMRQIISARETTRPQS
jgi:hypothetical protein